MSLALDVHGLSVQVDDGPLLLRDVALHVQAGEVVGLVGESGSGKTMASLALMDLLPTGISVTGGKATIGSHQHDLADPRTSRRGDMAMIFQNPRAALNPTMRVGRQVARAVALRQGASRTAARDEAVSLLQRVGIPGADRVARAYPHQLSGGMCQRVMIAMALACRPTLLIADEPTTGLDVTIQAQIFELLLELAEETGTGILFITHDLAAIAEMCDRVAVLYGGQVMEVGTTVELFEQPRNPYTRYLLDAVDLDVDPWSETPKVDFDLQGCRYANRCPHAFEACADVPPLYAITEEHRSACFLEQEERVGSA